LLVPQPNEIPTIRLDVGDTLGGSFFAHHFAEKSAAQFPQLALLNQLRWDALALGNADFSIGLPRLQQAQAQAAFPFLSANVLQPDNTRPFLPYTILQKGPLRVGVIGVTTPVTPLWHAESVASLKFAELVATVQSQVDFLRQTERVDLLVVLAHSGTNASFREADARFAGLPNANAAAWIADQVTGIDLLVSAHAHRVSPSSPQRQSAYRTPVVEPGAFGNGVMQVTWEIERKSATWIIQKAQYEWLAAKAEVAAPWREWLRWQREVDDVLNETTPFIWLAPPTPEAWTRCTQALSQLALPPPQRGLLPRWNLRRGNRPQRGSPLSRKNLHSWLPYRNHLQLMELLPSQVRHLQSRELLAVGITPEASSTTVWLTNYHARGNQGFFRALLAPSQLRTPDFTIWPERIFKMLKTLETLPPSCHFMERLERHTAPSARVGL
jgi:hypothetical protein